MIDASIAQTPTLIEIRGLTTRFGSHTVYEDIDLDIYSGEILGVVGGSGTGKSVLLRTMIGLLTPVSGQLRFLSDDVLTPATGSDNPFSHRCGVLFQNGALFSSMTVLENAALPLIEHAGLTRNHAQQLAKIKLTLAGLPKEAIFQYPSMLSGGMTKRAALARALALDPAILFLDEPTAGLDPISAAAFDKLIITLRNALGFTVFLVTHDLDTLYAICDRVAVLAHKKLVIADTLERVLANNDEWIKSYFHGPRGRTVQYGAHTRLEDG